MFRSDRLKDLMIDAGFVSGRRVNAERFSAHCISAGSDRLSVKRVNYFLNPDQKIARAWPDIFELKTMADVLGCYPGYLAGWSETQSPNLTNDSDFMKVAADFYLSLDVERKHHADGLFGSLMS